MGDYTSEELMRMCTEASIARATPLCSVPDIPEGEPMAEEWKTFIREVRHLIATGNRGRFAVIKGDRVDSLWDSQRDATQAVRMKFADGSALVQEIQTFIRPLRWGYYKLCQD